MYFIESIPEPVEEDDEPFDPRTRIFTDDELRPQPMLRKRKKQYVADEMKNEKYWAKRTKNNSAARKSREAKRLKENQVIPFAKKLRFIQLSFIRSISDRN